MPENLFFELTVPEIRALLLVLVLSRYSFRPLVDLLAAELPQCHPKRQAHLLASGNGVLLRRRQASGRPLQQGHLPLRMPRQAREDRRSQVWVSEPPWTRA